MNKLVTLTAVMALAATFGFAGAAMADSPESGFHSHGGVTAPIVDSDGLAVSGATCADGQPDGQCDGSEASITKGAFWGVRIRGVVLNGVGDLKICLEEADDTLSFLVGGLVPSGSKNTISAAGDLVTDVGSGIFEGPHFVIFAAGTVGLCDGTEEFRSGIALD